MKPRVNRKHYDRSRAGDPTMGSPASDRSVTNSHRKGRKQLRQKFDTLTRDTINPVGAQAAIGSGTLHKQDTFNFHDDSNRGRIPSRGIVQRTAGDDASRARAIAMTSRPFVGIPPLPARPRPTNEVGDATWSRPDPKNRLSTLSIASSVMAIAPLIQRDNEPRAEFGRTELGRTELDRTEQTQIADGVTDEPQSHSPQLNRVRSSRFSRAMKHWRSHAGSKVVVAAEATALNEWTSTLDFHLQPLEALQEPKLTAEPVDTISADTAPATFPKRSPKTKTKRHRPLAFGSWSSKTKHDDVVTTTNQDMEPLLTSTTSQEHLLASTATTLTMATTVDDSVVSNDMKFCSGERGIEASETTTSSQQLHHLKRAKFKARMRAFWHQIKNDKVKTDIANVEIGKLKT